MAVPSGPVPDHLADGGPSLRLQILGPLRLWRGDVELDPGPRQQAFLLAVLLARADRPVSRAELIDLIWDGEAPASALNVIHKYVGALRRVLQPGLSARGTGSYVHRRGDGYLFQSGNSGLDLVAFRELGKVARTAVVRRQHRMALDRMVEALALWHGPAGDGLGQGLFASPMFLALNGEFFEMCVAAAALAVPLGQPERVLPALRLAASMAPLNEGVHAALATSLGAAGHRAEALVTLRAARTRLVDELGVDPGPALRAAQRRVLAHRLETTIDGGTERADDGLVGRTGELAVLRETVSSAFAGGTGIVIVEGEPGVGKTRLLQEAAAEADRRGALVVWGSCLEGDGTPSMWPWVEVVTEVLNGLPDAAREKWLAKGLGRLVETRDEAVLSLPDSSTQFRLFETVVALVAEVAARRPVQLLVDDLQWADIASLQLFSHLAARLPSRTVVVGMLRDRAPTPGSNLTHMLGAVSRVPGHRRIRVGPLTVVEVAELVRRESGQDAGADARAIHARTAGNAYLVRELSRLLAGTWSSASTSVPATVRDVVRTRTAGLDEDARNLLQVAALIGKQVGLRLLAAAAGFDARTCLDRLEPLESLGLVEPTPGDPYTFRFVHDLVREAVVGILPTGRATVLHLRIADAYEGSGLVDESVVERLAYHLWASGPLADPARTVAALVRAGRRAVTKSAFEAAERHLRSAVRVAQTAGLAELELSALSLMATLFWRQQEFAGSYFELLERAEHLAHDLGRQAQAADFLFIRVVVAFSSVRADRVQLARRMLDQGTAAADANVRAYGWQAWGLYQWELGDITEALRYLRQGSRVALDAGSLHETDQLRRDLRVVGPLLRAVVEAMHGNLGEARALLDAEQAAAGDDPYAVSVWAHFATMTAAMVGDPQWAAHAAKQWIAADPEHLFRSVDSYLRVTWCWMRALTGHDPAAAATEAGKVVDERLVDPPRLGVAFHFGLVVDMFLAAGNTELAGATLARAEWFLDAHSQRYAEGLLLLLRARLLRGRGEPGPVVRAAADKARALSKDRGAHLFARRAEVFLATIDTHRP